MNPFHKRHKLSPTSSVPPAGSPRPGPQLPSHGAMLQPPPAGGGARQEEEDDAYLVVEEDTTDSSLIITLEDSQVGGKVLRRRSGRKRKRKPTTENVRVGGASESEEEAESTVDMEISRQLDQSLETKSKQHNLTTVNVRNIIHEVITNEHVVAMMKAAINETEAIPPFEPKMTRSKFKEVVEKGVVIPAWNISPIKKSSDVIKAPQFVDIPLAEEDSSDEEYHPDEEEEDETAEDTFQESDMESSASSPRGSRLSRGEEDSCSPWQTSRCRSRRLRAASFTMGPPPPPKAPPHRAMPDSSFLEKLHAVEEELAVCLEPYPALSESEDETGLMAYRTRSKRPLRDVPLGQLEAELRAPDITPDMYDSSSAHEDREWTDWLRGLMTSDIDNEEECDDEDDPEYNFLADIDEPDQEDYRDDKAVRITKKEVNELMEELFETLKEDLTGQEVEEEEEEPQEETHAAQKHTPEEQLNTAEEEDEQEEEPITELRTVRQQLELIRRRRAQGLPTHTLCNTHTECEEPYTLRLNDAQRSRLTQQLQQHVQLLTQIHLLSSPVTKLHSEAETTRQFLCELEMLAQRSELLSSSACPPVSSVFRASNLQGALQLLEELRQTPISYQSQPRPPDSRGHMRSFPVMPAELAWLFATRSVFLYPELLPCASLDPALYCPRRTAAFTAAEDCLLVLGLRNMEGSSDPTKLVSQFLLRKTLVQVRRRILQCCRPGYPDNIVKAFRYQRVLWPMLVACRAVGAELRPPVEREESLLPLWLQRSLPVIYPTVKHFNGPSGSDPEAPPPCRPCGPRHSHLTFLRSASKTHSFPPGTQYPPLLPKNLDFRRMGFVQLNKHLPPPSDSAPYTDDQVDSPCLPSPPAPAPQRPLLSKTATPGDIITTSDVSMTTRERISRHYQTLAGLSRRERSNVTPPPPGDPVPPRREEQGGDDVIRTNEEEEEEESEVVLALSESSPSSMGSAAPDDRLGELEEAESEDKQEVIQTPSRTTDGEETGSPGAKVCDALQVRPGATEDLLQVLDQFSAKGPLGDSGDLKHLYSSLSQVLGPWPQLLRDFAAFLSPEQARSCNLLTEQQLFERSRKFLRGLGRSLGEDSSLYQQVVSVLQGGPAPSPEDMQKISCLLKGHPDVHKGLWEFLQQLGSQSLVPNSSDATEINCITHNPPEPHRDGEEPQTSEESETVSDREQEEEEEEEEEPVPAATMTTREGRTIWTREEDRAILTSCQQRGANQRTFRQVSAHLGNKSTQQVSQRFRHLIKLFHVQKTTSCSSESRPIRIQEAARD
ncbi:GON-4-like protein [Halichoeres trimaculatus]|uniref:GON-4-like protein n=1 Tax=Halichoeres trimaculatus TaxID=147232 RepID=UPI003D9F6FC7